MIQLSEHVIMREVADLLGATSGVTVDDIIIADGFVSCKGIPGGIRMTDTVLRMSLDEFSSRLLVPWLTRMARLKLLREDLKALGVIKDD